MLRTFLNYLSKRPALQYAVLIFAALLCAGSAFGFGSCIGRFLFTLLH